MIRVHVQAYNNPTNRCASCFTQSQQIPGCCDNFSLTTCNGQLRCDNVFIYCLRPHNTQIGDCGEYTARLISEVNIDGEDIDFSQDTVLGLPNPLTLTGLTNSWQVSTLSHITLCVPNSHE